MNGRCEHNPLDRAVDVCDSCYGEYCRTCLVSPKGRRHPICTDCARARSAVRGASAITPRGAKRTARQRRKDLQAAWAAADDVELFRFFDEDAPLDAGAGPPGASDRADHHGDDGHQPVRQEQAVAVLAPHSPAEHAVAEHAVAEHAVAEHAVAEHAGDHDDNPGSPSPSDAGGATGRRRRRRRGGDAHLKKDSAPEPHLGPATPTVGTADPLPTPAVARLQALRRQIAEVIEEPGPTPEPWRTTATMYAEHRTDDLRPASDTLSGPVGGTPAWDPIGYEPAHGEPAHGEPAHGEPAPGEPAPGEPAPGEQSGDRRRAEVPLQSRPGTAPMIGEIRIIGGRRSSDRIEVAAPATTAAGEPAPAGAVARFDAGQPPGPAEFVGRRPDPAVAAPGNLVQASSGPSRGASGRADVDAKGNWVPPALRGATAPEAGQDRR